MFEIVLKKVVMTKRKNVLRLSRISTGGVKNGEMQFGARLCMREIVKKKQRKKNDGRKC